MSERAPSVIGIGHIAIDCERPRQLGEFWAAVLGGALEVSPDGDATLSTPTGHYVDFLRVPELKERKNRMHFDLHSLDLGLAVKEVQALGATKADDISCGARFQVLRDPEGNEFCILSPRT